MKLLKVRIENFRSIEDSGEFEVDDMTCLVGKNEAGKTALLEALSILRPHNKNVSKRNNNKYIKTDDYPRRHVTNYDQRHPNGNAIVATTWWRLSKEAKEQLTKEFGRYFITDDVFTVKKGYRGGSLWDLKRDEHKAIKHIIRKFALTASEKKTLENKTSALALKKRLDSMSSLSEKQRRLSEYLDEYDDDFVFNKSVKIIQDLMPYFFYMSSYDRMSGMISVDHLENHEPDTGEEIFLQFLEFAGAKLEDINNSKRNEEIIAKCEAASNYITDQIFEYWTQNKNLEIELKIGPGKLGDPEPFNSGTIVQARIRNHIHRVTVPFSERSAGFVWFFSFLIKFSQIRQKEGNLIILLDEPGLNLHGKAQADLLRYMEEKLLPYHQVIFTTHSPFMVPTHRLGSVRIVEDVIDNRVSKGTKVTTDVLRVDGDTLFPLRGALGYDIAQSLFIGKNTLLVEGPSDILYLQAFSEVLTRQGRECLDTQWIVCPTGGINKISSFISLFGGNNLNVAVLTDYHRGEKSNIRRIKEGEILRAGHLYTFADFVDKNEADIEDVFEKELFIQIINRTFNLREDIQLEPELIDSSGRLVKQVEEIFRNMSPDAPNFDHFTPASWLIKNLDILENSDDSVLKTLERAERIFQAFNKLLG